MTAPDDHIAAKPQSLGHGESAALPCAALTAWQSLVGVARLRRGQRVLIHAAAGGVGRIAVQLACYIGACVIGTASRRNAEYVIEVGAHAFIDYQAARFEDCVRDVDVVLDPIGGDTRERSWRTLRVGGMLVSIQGAPSEEDAARHGVRAEPVLVRPHAGQLAAIAGLVDNGAIRPTISAVYPHQVCRGGPRRRSSRAYSRQVCAATPPVVAVGPVGARPRLFALTGGRSHDLPDGH